MAYLYFIQCLNNLWLDSFVFCTTSTTVEVKVHTLLEYVIYLCSHTFISIVFSMNVRLIAHAFSPDEKIDIDPKLTENLRKSENKVKNELS